MARTLWVGFVVFLFTLLCGPFCMLLALVRGSPEILYRLGRFGCRLGLTLAGIRVQTKGLEVLAPQQNYLFLANHQSYCDPPALVASIPRDVRLILKQELWRLPVLGAIMSMGGFVFIDRGQHKQAIERMRGAVEQLRQGHSFLIYPEGTRTRSGRLGQFKKLMLL